MASNPNTDTSSTKAFFFDLETNGLLDDVSVIHSLVVMDVASRELLSFCDFTQDGAPKDPDIFDDTIADGLRMLSRADKLIGHNIINYDLPVISKLHPEITLTDNVEDTLLLARLLFGDIKDTDFRVRERDIAMGRTPRLPGSQIGNHRLEAWGYRLGEMKGEYTEWCKQAGIDPWTAWNPQMQAYCGQDVRVTAKLWDLLVRQPAYQESDRARWIEHEFAKLIFKQHRHGFRFNEAKARALEAKLRERKAVLYDELLGLFKPWYVNLGPRAVNKKMTRWVPSDLGSEVRERKIDTGETAEVHLKNGKTAVRKVYETVSERGYYEGIDPETTQDRVELRVFNPASRMHIADRLKKLYGWEPAEFTNNGEPVIDDDVLSALPYPPAQALAEYFMLEKRLGQLADGNQAWLRLVKNGRIHGSVNTLGAITHRCTHSYPNIAQVPSIENAKGKVPYGAECRDLFEADEDHVLIGADADGLELRCLAHFMRDGGRYAKAVDEGDKDKGTDIHTMNQKAAGLPSRATAKTFIYAFLYGAGNEKIGSIVGGSAEQGGALKAKFLKGTPGLADLIRAVKAAAKANGYVRGIDGRRVPVRHQHAALNTLLQNAGAVPMKLAPVLLYQRLSSEGLEWGADWAMVAHVHDEMQITCRPEHQEAIKTAAVWSIEEAGRQLNFNIPLRANAVCGSSWKETH
jgi:hypothetical protein